MREWPTALCELRAHSRQLQVDDVAKRPLRVVRDRDRAEARLVVKQNELMVLGVFLRCGPAQCVRRGKAQGSTH
jgi:hypothetical protein